MSSTDTLENGDDHYSEEEVKTKERNSFKELVDLASRFLKAVAQLLRAISGFF
ncbi:hypothetical protein [Salinibacter ruber]|uniref:hypothetical protein n=1 Tax=Salinibacter ruber TaxID=146919 RepID=UPI002073B731|nr:hypothetical protein [Salinibacter ruber]